MIKLHFLSFDALAGVPKNGRWEPVAFDESKHLLFAVVDNEAALVPWIEKAMVTPLVNKASGPWWEIHAVSTRDASQALLFFRVEHACADGIALTQVLSRVCTSLDGSPMPAAAYTKRPKEKADFCAVLCAALKAAFKYAVLPFGPYDSDLPITPPLAERAAGLHFNGQRKLVQVPPHPLSQIKAIKNAAGDATTINDVIYAAFAGALRRYCQMRAEQGSWESASWENDATAARALVPITFPRAADAPLINDWTFVNTELPLLEETPAARLAKVRARPPSRLQ
eukprot:581987-Prymnesium_polylepis.1